MSIISILSACLGNEVSPESDYPLVTNSFYADYWIVAVNNQYELSINGTDLQWSSDNGASILRTIAFADAQSMRFGHIFSNGNVLFAINNKIYKSTDQLVSYSLVTVLDTDDSPYSLSSAGEYFTALSQPRAIIINNQELIVWGNYANVFSAAVALNVYQAFDDCSVKVAYKFGVHPNRPGVGDPSNPIVCRHIHNVQYNSFDNKWYMFTGDDSLSGVDEVHWFTGQYNSTTDVWTWNKLLTSDQTTRYKATGMWFIDDKIYWGSDKTGSGGQVNGIWYSTISNITTYANHVLLANQSTSTLYTITDLIYDYRTGVFAATHFSTPHQRVIFYVSLDGLSKKLVSYNDGDLLVTFMPKNDNGYYRLLTNYTQIPQSTATHVNGESLYVRIGTDIFD